MAKTPKLFRPEPGVTYSKTQVNKAGETLRDYYFVNRYGEKVSEDVPQEDIDAAVEAMRCLHWWRSTHADPMSNARASLWYHVSKATSLDPKVAQRLKRVPTIIDKLEREPEMKLARMADIAGVRAQLPSIDSVYAVARRLKKNWTIKKEHDYIKSPKPSGYRAYHLIASKSSRLVEVQLRTFRQGAWANSVEKDGRIEGAGYKFGRGEDSVLAYYAMLAEAFAAMDAGEQIDPDLREEINDRYHDLQKSTPVEGEAAGEQGHG